jgi:hypothetical protein
MNMQIFELVLNKETDGVDAISVVDKPAIESDWIALKEHIKIEFTEVDNDKRILMGAALIPNKQIFRKNGKDEFYVYFSSETIKQASELFLINGNQNNATLMHDKAIKDMSVVESWIIDNPEMDKSKEYGFSLPKGTWMISMKCNNDEIWSKVKAGEIKGFSIEGYFADKAEMSSKNKELIQQLKELLNGNK